MLNGEEELIMVCQGPPNCLLEGKEQEDAQEAGCDMCAKLYIDEFGNQTVVNPMDRMH